MSASKKRQKTAQINIKVDPALKSAAEKYAEADSRSLTSLIEAMLYERLREKGYLPPAAL